MGRIFHCLILTYQLAALSHFQHFARKMYSKIKRQSLLFGIVTLNKSSLVDVGATCRSKAAVEAAEGVSQWLAVPDESARISPNIILAHQNLRPPS